MPKMTGCVVNGPCWEYQRSPSTLAEHGRHIYTFCIHCLQECARAKRETVKLDVCEPVKLSAGMRYVIVPPARAGGPKIHLEAEKLKMPERAGEKLTWMDWANFIFTMIPRIPILYSNRPSVVSGRITKVSFGLL